MKNNKFIINKVSKEEFEMTGMEYVLLKKRFIFFKSAICYGDLEFILNRLKKEINSF